MAYSKAGIIFSKMNFPNLKQPSHLFATWFGVGLIRPAPGTWGSLAALLIWYFAEFLHSSIHIILPVFILFSWLICSQASQDSDSKDHSAIVIDEVAGMLVALSFVSSWSLSPTSVLFCSLDYLIFGSHGQFLGQIKMLKVALVFFLMI